MITKVLEHRLVKGAQVIEGYDEAIEGTSDCGRLIYHYDKHGVCHKCEAEAKTKRLRRLLWSAGNGQLPQDLVDEMTKLEKELS